MKAIAHPTDSHLLLRAIEWLNRLAKKQGVAVRQSYLRVARRARREVGRLMHAGQRRQAERWVRKLRTWTGRLTRDIERKTAGEPDLVGARALVLERVKRLLAQKRDDRNKLYALHAPEVECIAKGKARARYAFGVKVSIAVTIARAAGGQFVLGVKAMPGLPYDGHTLSGQIAQVERLTGEKVARVYVDKGYRGHGLAAPEIHVTQSPGQRLPTVKRELRRRAAVEPIIGHAKSDGLLERNRLAGARGDAINAILVGAEYNIRLLLAWLRVLLRLLLLSLAAPDRSRPLSAIRATRDRLSKIAFFADDSLFGGHCPQGLLTRPGCSRPLPLDVYGDVRSATTELALADVRRPSTHHQYPVYLSTVSVFESFCATVVGSVLVGVEMISKYAYRP